MFKLLLSSFLFFTLAAAAQDRPDLFFREDWKETPPAKPVTLDHLANSNLTFTLYGPGKEGIKKSNHDKPADDPFYIWTGECVGNCAIALKHKTSYVDLRGQSKLKWRSKQAGFRGARIILKLANGKWLVSDAYDGPSLDWREREFNIQDIRWRRLDIDKIIEGAWVDNPDLSRVDEIGWTDLMTGGGSISCTRVDWIEIYGKPVPRGQSPSGN